MQFFDNLPKSTKILLIVIVFGLVAAGAVQLNDLSIFLNNTSDNEIEKVNVSFVIRDDNNNPLENVNVAFQGTDTVESRRTDSNGYVSINMPSRQKIEVVMSKEGYITQRKTISLEIDSENTETYYLEKNENSTINQSNTNLETSHIISQNQCEKSIEIDEFKISLQKCEKLQSNLILYFVIENLGRPRNIAFYTNNSRIYDRLGNVNDASEVYIGQSKWSNSSQAKLPSEASIKAALKFNDLFIEQNNISVFELNTSLAKLEFRDLKL